MTGPRPDRFQKALEHFKQTLPPNLVDKLSVCTLDDVRDICCNIQKEHGLERKLRHMRRLEPFVEAMEQFGKVIEPFTNVNEIVCFIWGPIKFLLGVARTHIDSFDKLLDAYDKIGNAIPGLSRYQTIFEEHPPLATVLEDYYSDILGFHQAALSVFSRSKWKELFHSTWKTFDSKFEPILRSLERRRELLESEKGSATLYELQRIRRDISNIYTKERNRTVQEDAEKHRREVYQIREKLEAPNYRIDQELSTEDRHGHNSGMWIFKDASFCSWSRDDTSGHNILYVNGIPGAGKTTLMSVVIEKLLEEKKDCIAYFYFKQKQPNKVSHNSALRALLLQLVERDSTLSDHLSEKISSIESVNLRSTKVLESFVKAALETYRISYIILDGLDECDPNEAEKSVGWFLSLIKGGLVGTNVALRVLFCGQRDGTLDTLLSDQPSISLEAHGHSEDVRQYCQSFSKKIREKFKISPEMEEEITLKVTNEAQGMFLYARVVLENLLNQTRRSRLREELEPGTFPQGIEKAYERVAMRIFKDSPVARREDAKKILGWIICARRLLRWREIQSLFCIDPVKGDVEYEERRLRDTCKELCGSLVDVHHASDMTTGPEDVIKIVHETAREYLVRREWLDASLEHARLAIFCSRYLTSEPFKYTINENEIAAYAVKGYYGLQDYAVQFWFHHFQSCTEQIARLDTNLYSEVMSVAKIILVSYGLPSKVGRLSDTEGFEEAARTLACLPEDGYERNTYLNIEHRTTLIRNAIEALDRSALHPTAQEILTDLHGSTAPYKCTKPWCESFTAGFGNAEDRKRHLNRHDRPFRCSFDSCFASQLGCDTRAKLDQHQKSYHPDLANDVIRFPKMATKKKMTIWTAATRGDLDAISSLLDSGTDINRPSRSTGGETPIYLAAKFGHLQICKMLLERGADTKIPETQNGRTALHVAVVAGNIDIVHLLVSQGRHLDNPDAHGRSPFCDACALGHLDIVKLLIETGVIATHMKPDRHPDCCNDKSYAPTLTPLGYACVEGHFAVVQYLLEEGQSNLVNKDILERASQRGHEDIVELLRPIIVKLENDLSQSNSLIDYSSTASSPSDSKSGREPEFSVTERNDWSVTFSPAIPPPDFDITLAHTLEQEKITCVRFSPDGKCLAIGSKSLVQIHDVTTGGQLYAFDENITHAIGGDSSIKVWEISTGSVRSTLSGEQKTVKSLAFTHYDRNIVSIDSHGTIQLWNLDTLTSLTTLSIGDADVSTISPNTEYVAASSIGGLARVWNTRTNQLVGSLRTLEWVSGIAFSPNGSNLVSFSDKIIKMWDIVVLEELAKQGLEEKSFIRHFKGHKTPVRSVALTSDGQWVLSGSVGGEVLIWDRNTGEPRFGFRGHKKPVDFITASPTGDYFATGSSTGAVRIWSFTRI
ncbi:hypothetical protein EV127DRAFT_188087 [Xylaria flabelliformis]|nr:hypothetical protein EV127DRAFT_188087 [Xylaria flabelliformis]